MKIPRNVKISEVHRSNLDWIGFSNIFRFFTIQSNSRTNQSNDTTNPVQSDSVQSSLQPIKGGCCAAKPRPSSCPAASSSRLPVFQVRMCCNATIPPAHRADMHFTRASHSALFRDGRRPSSCSITAMGGIRALSTASNWNSYREHEPQPYYQLILMDMLIYNFTWCTRALTHCEYGLSIALSMVQKTSRVRASTITLLWARPHHRALCHVRAHVHLRTCRK